MLGRNGSFAASQIVVTSVALFVVYRIVADTLGVAALGVWSVSLGVCSLCKIADLGVTDAMIRQVAYLRRNQDWAPVAALVRTSQTFVLLCVGTCALAVFPLLAAHLPHFIGYPESAESTFILGAALVVVCLNVAAAGLTGTLEGCERFDLRLVVGVISSCALLLGALTLVPMLGTKGLATAFVAQSATSFVSASVLVRRSLPACERGGWMIRPALLHDLVKLGLPLTLIGIVNLGFEPIIRLLVVRFGGTEWAGLYEIGARLASQLRGLIVGAVQVIVPRLVSQLGKEDDAFQRTYVTSSVVTLDFSITAFGALALGLPVLSWLLLGSVDKRLLDLGWVIAFGWWVNCLSAPAYFANLAEGRLRWNATSHLVLALVNLGVGIAFGSWFHAIGVVVASSLALVVASTLTILSRGSQRSSRRSANRFERWLVLVALAHLAAFATAYGSLAFGPQFLAVSFILAASFGLVGAWLSLRSYASRMT